MFNLFGKKQPVEETVRKKITSAFDESVRSAVRRGGMDNPFLGGLMVQAAVASVYQSLKNSSELETLCDLNGLDYQSILEEECNKALQRYLE